jgi:ADP-dependent phosphofructokinase/glucokinase
MYEEKGQLGQIYEFKNDEHLEDFGNYINGPVNQEDIVTQKDIEISNKMQKNYKNHENDDSYVFLSGFEHEEDAHMVTNNQDFSDYNNYIDNEIESSSNNTLFKNR